jgi:hypothetical protein
VAVAGVTVEERAASQRLPDRISLGVLARTFTPGLLDEVIDAADAREVRYRLLPARLVLVFVLACWLFMRSGYGQVLGKIADAQVLGGLGGWQVPTTSSLAKARVRLGPQPVRLLFERVAGPVGVPGVPGVFWRDHRLVTMDGFTCDVPDTKENAEHFGRGANGSGTPNPYPQLRAVALAEGGTRSLLAVRHGPHSSGEQTLAAGLAAALGPGMLCLADRNFASWRLWRTFTATGADLLWRMSASFTLPVIEVLADGSWISELKPPRKRDGPPIRVRIVEYTVWTTTTETGETMSELFCLATTLLDPDTAPMAELADLYHARWQAETGIGELKTTVRGGPEVVFRSKTPDLVDQEFCAMLCVYQAIRDLIAYATPAELDPGRISFTNAIEAVRDWATRAALSPRSTSRSSSSTSAPG